MIKIKIDCELLRIFSKLITYNLYFTLKNINQESQVQNEIIIMDIKNNSFSFSLLYILYNINNINNLL